MKFFLRLLLALAGIAGTFVFTGCTSQTDADSSIPWSRPANWEGQVPGMGTGKGSGIR
ncbi:hypothetical protein [Synoicihabitans lomoniglobus]|uniref:Lipoprotein n=1 Tax=Synoicihabitans lomoniglobus TaxID=2909285 RepID=A0AAF0I7V1_9BACT|nr:hypothetical protein [Opitutaceae bacterium LMO-M01]WED67036.1 hypothetical protein PXH66_09255 [Opitutaceae bacterium LMO-M01]